MTPDDEKSPHPETHKAEEETSVRDNAANPKQPTKPDPAKNPTGVAHNPAQGGPSTRRNPEAGKKD